MIGSLTLDGLTDPIALNSYALKASVPASTSGGGGAGKITFTPLELTFPDSSTALRLTPGTTFRNGTITLLGSDGKPVLTIGLSLVQVTSQGTTSDATTSGPEHAAELAVGAVQMHETGSDPVPSASAPASAAPSGS